jgi:hypothetical protein
MNSNLVPIEQIIADPSAWPRKELDRERVEDFRELYESDGLAVLPPLRVVQRADGYLLADGWHRHAALSELACPEVPIEIIESGGRSEEVVAFEEGLRSCATTSRPLTRAEKHAAVMRLTVEGGRTDREIGRLVGLSHQTVARVRAARATGPSDHPQDEAPSIDPSSLELTRRLVRSLQRIWVERGLTDVFANRMPRNLADALLEEFGEDEAVVWARRLAAWSGHALQQLEGR